jgi:hypothetical protein
MLAQKLILGYSSRLVTRFVTMAAGIIATRLAGQRLLHTVAFDMLSVAGHVTIAGVGLGGACTGLAFCGRSIALYTTLVTACG